MHSLGFDFLIVMAAASFVSFLLWVRLRQVSIRLREQHAARLSERDRIARELHDTLLQAMEGLILKVYAAARQLPAGHPTYALLTQSLEQAEELAIEGRRKLFELRDQQSRPELSQSLSALGLELSADATITFTATRAGRVRTLDLVAWDEIFGIVREAVRNAFKHSTGSHIETIVTYGPSKLMVQIRDDGIGMRARKHTNLNGIHFGIRGMRERARQLRASMAIQTAEGAGTHITLQVPAHIAYRRDDSEPESVE
jgi:signal transduction histidine kinase